MAEQRVTDKLVEGDTINLQPVAKTTTASDGSFTLRLPGNATLSPFAGKDQIVNMEIISTANGQVSAHSFARRLEPVGGAVGVARLALTDPLGTSVSAPSAFRSATVDGQASEARPEQATMTLAHGSSAGAPPDGATATAQTDAPVMKSCSSTLRKNLGLQWVLVGQHYSSASYVRSRFVYSTGATSSLGVAISGNGSFGSYSRSGSVTKKSSGTLGYPDLHGKANAFRDTEYKYGRYYVTCYEGYPGVASHYYEVRPTSWAGGTRTRHPNAPAATRCVPQRAGSYFIKRTSTAVEWTNGADLSSTIGIDLSARTGYSSDAEVRFDFSRTRRLCGTGDFPGGTPYQLRARMPA